MGRIGIFQGRLSSSINNEIQSFPFHNWENEFKLANKIGFDLIEWIIGDEIDKNPIFFKENINKIEDLINKNSINVDHICLDFLMKNNIFDSDMEYIIDKIFEQVCFNYNIHNIELPLLGKSSLKEYDVLKKTIEYLDKIILKYSIDIKSNILIETDLEPREIMNLLKNVNNIIKINYDTGNSTYWGYNEIDEFENYGSKIGSVHIKDCTIKDYSVPLGQGEVNFDNILKLLYKHNYKNDFILQPARENNEIKCAKKNLLFLKQKINESFN